MNHTTEVSPMTESTTTADKVRSVTSIDADTLTVTINKEVFHAARLPQNVANALMLDGLRMRLRNADVPSTVYAKLLAGDAPAFGHHQFTKGARPARGLSPWRQAYANALIEQRASNDELAEGTEEYASLVADCMAKSVELSTARLAKAKTVPAIIAHHAALVGQRLDIEDV